MFLFEKKSLSESSKNHFLLKSNKKIVFFELVTF
jgi:hypothetical protein